MGLGIGIVGLPNVGKSTLFNALTKAQNAQTANYPFCTIEPNKAVVIVSDERLNKLAGLVNPVSTIFSTIDFYDIAGLVKGASKGEGLGNQFLSHIREAKALIHIVRCFEHEDIVHVTGKINPVEDIQTVETELLLADIQTVEKKLDKLQKLLKGDKSVKDTIVCCESLLEFLNEGKPAILFPDLEKETFKQILKETGVLTAKRVIYCCNVDEDGLAVDNDYVKMVKDFASRERFEVVKISAKIEEELVGLDESERIEYLTAFGIEEGGLEKIIRKCFQMLELISFFTTRSKELRAWTIPRGTKAPQAAGVIHTDFERGFIRAEVVSYEDLIKYGSEAECRHHGIMRTEGKDYEVQDGDVIHFLFNV